MKNKLRKMEHQISQLQEAGSQSHYANVVEIGKNTLLVGNNFQSQEVDLVETIEVCLTKLDLREKNKPRFLDSSASQHVTGDKNALQSIEQDKTTSIKIASRKIILVTGKGNVLLTTRKGIKEIPHILYVSCIQKNLFSVHMFSGQGHLVAFNSHRCIVFSKDMQNGIFLKGTRDPLTRFYRMEAATASPQQHIKVVQTVSID
jgi:hypothetical protein